MKKLFTILVLSSFILTTSSISAQRRVKSDVFASKPRANVELSRAEAFTDGNGVWLRWTTESESKNLGFNIYRIDGGESVLVTPNIIPATHLQMPEQEVSGREYSFFDPAGGFTGKYYIESVGLGGQKKTFDLILPQYVSDLTPIAGASSEFLQAAKADSNPNITKTELVIPADLQLEMKNAEAEADSDMQRWVAAQPGVKIGVKQEGIYRVTRAQLEAAGFNVNSSPELWQLYVKGVEQSIIVAPNGEYIEFYGKGIDTHETDTQNYFLLVGTGSGKRIQTRAARSVGGNVVASSYFQTFEKKERVNHYGSIFNGDEENFFGTIITSSGASVNFNLTGIEAAQNVSLVLRLQGITISAHETLVVLNGTELGTMSVLGRNPIVKQFDISSTLLREGVNTLRFEAKLGNNDISMFDNIKITYARRYLAEQNQLSFYTNNYRVSKVTGFASSNIRVFDITSPDAPAQLANLKIEQDGSGFSVRIPAYRARLMYAVSNEAIKQPASIVQNVPSSFSNSAHNADLIIITHKNFAAQAIDWANYRSSQGVTVRIVDIEDIYDEFNFGNSSSLSIKNFLEYAKNNWQTPPDYVLLIGDASHDPRNYLGRGNWNLAPTKMVDTVYTETGSDDALTDFNNDGLAEIPIGRIPARTTANVTLVLNKVKVFEQNLSQAISRGALCVSDLPEGYDFSSLCNRVFDQLSPNFNKSFINRADTDAHNKLITSLNEGKYIVNYSGHGSVTAWSSASSFFNSSHAGQLTNNNLTIFTMLTCLNGYFVEPGNNSFSESALFASGGAVAAWASTGLTTPDVQEVMAIRFYKKLSEGSITRIGDLINDAKTTIPFGRDVRLSWALLGDPMLKVR